MYLAYSQHSGDAARPTFTALMRHLSFDEPEATFDVVPDPSSIGAGEGIRTLDPDLGKVDV